MCGTPEHLPQNTLPCSPAESRSLAPTERAGLSRRNLLKGGALALSGLMLSGGESRPGALSTPERSGHIDPVVHKLAIVALRDPSSERKNDLGILKRHFSHGAKLFSRSTLGTHQYSIESVSEQALAPQVPMGDYYGPKDSSYCYGRDQIRQVLKESYSQHPDTMPVIIPGGNDDIAISCGLYSGMEGAYAKGIVEGVLAKGGANPQFIPDGVVLGKEGMSGGCFMHELGHAFKTAGSPDTSKALLGHQAEIDSKDRFSFDAEGRMLAGGTNGTLQDLIRSGALDFFRDLQGNPDEYGSGVSIMGRRRNWAFGLDGLINPLARDPDYRPGILVPPLLSAIEIASIAPDQLRVEHDVDKLASGKKLYLTYDPKGTLGLKIPLPADHELHKLIPGADHLFIGPSLDDTKDMPDTTPYHDRRLQKNICVFVGRNDSNDTVHLTTGYFSDIPEDGRLTMLLADEQLGRNGTVIAAGRDERGEYVQLLPLDSSAGRSLFDATVKRDKAHGKEQFEKYSQL